MSTPIVKSRPAGVLPSFTAVPQQQPVAPSVAKRTIAARKLHKKLQKKKAAKTSKNPVVLSAAAGFASNTVQGAPSIVEMARALKSDIDLIFEFIVSNIEYIPTFGSQKGALGTLIDGYGNAFDQSSLMVALAQEAGYTAGFVYGDLDLSEAEAAAWLGTDVDAWAASNMLANGGIPNQVVWTGSEYRLEMSHCWVRVDIGGTYYAFDPARKSYTTTSAINLATATGFSSTSFMSDATSGATVTSDYVQDLNRANIRSNLADYTDSLVDWIKTNDPGANLDDILGGRAIVPQSGQVRQTSLSYQKSGSTPTNWTSIPNTYRTTFEVLYDTIDEAFYSDEIHGKRLTLFFNGSHEAELKLDGTLIDTSSAQTPGSWNSVLLTITHPYPTTFADQAVWHRIWADKPYLIAQAWGNASREMVDLHNDKLIEAQSGGGTSGSEPVLGEYFSLLYHTWNAQKSFVADIINRMSNCTTVLHHQCGVVGYYDAPLTDLGCILWASSALDNDYDRVKYNDDALALHGVAFEAGAIQQVDQRMDGVSTTPLFDIANTAGMKIYDGKSANWSSNVKPNLTNYPSGDLTDIENWYINWGWRVGIPEDGALTSEDWNGYGYFAISPWQGSYGIISGALKGGGGNKNKPNPEEEKKKKKKEKDKDKGKDPTNLQTGSYLHEHTDLTVGSAGYPYGLSFSRYYNSGSRHSDGPMGRGWSHSFELSASEDSDGLRAMGYDSPIAGAAVIAEIFVCVELFKDLTKPFDKYVVAVLGNQWAIEQMTKNIVSVQFVGSNQFFVRMPDGSYVAPNDSASILVKNVGGDFSYTTPQGIEYNYNTDGTIDEIVYPNGVTISFTYTSGKLTSISNGMGRTLSLTYTGDRVTSVSDGNGRSVSYSYDSNGSLTTFTNANSKSDTYEYDQPGRLTKVFLPAKPLAEVIENIYDSLGRVKQQVDANGNNWYYYIAGSRSEEVNPAGKSRTIYFDRFGSGARYINALGQESTVERDGRGRIIKATAPEGNSVEYEYNEDNNVTKVTSKAKSGAGLSDIVQTFTYDSTWKKLKTSTDPLGRVTTFNYDGSTGNLTSIVGPTIGGTSTPTISFTYNSRGQVLTRTDETGIVTKFNYDSTTEKLTSVVHDEGTGRLNLTTSFGYDSVGNITSVTDPNGNTTFYTVDSLRRTTEVAAPSPWSYVSQYVYDDNNRLTTVKRQTGNVSDPWQTTSWTYTDSGKVATVTDPDGEVTTFSYDSVDRLWKVTDAEARVKEVTFDDLSRVVTVKEAGTTVATYDYSDNGLMSLFTDARGKDTSFEYDGFDRRKKVIFEDSSYNEWTYNANSLITNFRTRAADDIGFSYDEVGRMTQRTAPSLSPVSFEYDLAGRVTLVSASPGIEFGYDTAGRLTSETRTADSKTVSYDLDANGNATKVTYPDSYYVDRSYDELNRLTDVKLNGASTPAASFTYNDLSQRTNVTLENGAETNYTYTKAGQVATVNNKFAGTDEVTFEYEYDGTGLVTRQDVDNGDFLWHPASGGTKSYGTAGDTNEYPTVGGVSQSYDDNGTLTGDGTWTYAYDSRNRMTSASKTGLTVGFSNDVMDRQVGITVGSATKDLFYAGSARLADYDQGTGNLDTRYVYGVGQEPLIQVAAGGAKTYLQADGAGSVIATTNASAARTGTLAYGPSGEPSGAAISTFGLKSATVEPNTGLVASQYRPEDERPNSAGPAAQYNINNPVNQAIDALNAPYINIEALNFLGGGAGSANTPSNTPVQYYGFHKVTPNEGSNSQGESPSGSSGNNLVPPKSTVNPGTTIVHLTAEAMQLQLAIIQAEEAAKLFAEGAITLATLTAANQAVDAMAQSLAKALQGWGQQQLALNPGLPAPGSGHEAGTAIHKFFDDTLKALNIPNLKSEYVIHSQIGDVKLDVLIQNPLTGDPGAILDWKSGSAEFGPARIQEIRDVIGKKYPHLADIPIYAIPIK
ncbi:MAG: DUF6531 domain-containing protein [Candidatus Obscuribacterales bacterium]